MAYFLSPLGNTQTIDANGDPLVGGTIETYLAGTTTAETTYTDDTGGTPQGVVMTLNSLGLPTNGPVWMLGGVPLKFIIKDADGVTLSTFDDVSGIGDTSSVVDQWQLYGAAPTYISATSFSVVGDQTNTFQSKRKLKSNNSGGTVYSTISTSSFGAGVTTVVVVNTSGVLDADMSSVSYGFLSSVNDSIPTTIARVADIQTQAYTAFTTAGTTTAYTLTPSPAITALSAGQRFRVKFNAANTTTTPTIAVSGLAATALKIVAPDGSKQNPEVGALALNLLVDVEYDGTDFVLLTRSVPPTSLGTPVAATSGTSIDFTSIPAWARQIRINFAGVSTNGTSPYAVQLGDAGGVEVSGYVGSAIEVIGAVATNLTSSFRFGSANAANILHGSVFLTLESSATNTWVCSAQLALSNGGQIFICAGSKPLSATLDRVRITTEGGVNTFDAGEINITYQ